VCRHLHLHEATEEGRIACRTRELNRMDTLGLAISGGGIRSATFALGVIQALAEERMLRYVDYLSTVSGGGYIGSWLSKLIYTEIKEEGTADKAAKTDVPKEELRRFDALERSLQPPVSEHAALIEETETPREHPSIGWLREFSNYLAPRVGMFSADVWSIATIWVRNTILNQVILAATLGVLMLIPYLFREFPQYVKPWFGGQWPDAAFSFATVLFVVALGILSRGVRAVAQDGKSTLRQKWAVVVSVLLYLAAYFPAAAMQDLTAEEASGDVATVSRLRYATFLVVALGSAVAAWAGMRKDIPLWRTIPSALGASLIVTLVFSTGLYVIRPIISYGQPGVELVLATSAILLLFGLQVVLILGVLGRGVTDLVREWWARLGAWLSIIAVTMGLLAVAAFCAHDILSWIAAKIGAPWAALVWIATNVIGISAGASPSTSGEKKTPGLTDKVKEYALSMVPAVFAIGAILLVGTGVHVLMRQAVAQRWLETALISLTTGLQAAISGITDTAWPGVWSGGNPHAFVYVVTALAVFGGLALLLSWRVDVNEFSMHNFYRNRLVRCYLGASNKTPLSQRDRLTNFSQDDDIPLTAFRHDYTDSNGTEPKPYLGPLPIINAAINLATPDTGKQERRADSFVFTPYYCGFHTGADSTEAAEDAAQQHFLSTQEYCDPLSLGHVFTVSGAAASPNMGYHTSGAVALLMTIFNVRLGWWFPNPAETYKDKWSPRVGILPLVRELFALADKNYSFVYVSDGGHFENLGVYELLRRRCRYIICCDAEEDGEFCFGGLGGLVRKARADFGIEIQIDPRSIARRNERGDSEVHCAVGNIWYPESDLTGTLLYLKSSVTGDEPADILQYRAAEKKFPHQTTGDQFFSESQFESYRRLGYHIARTVFKPIRDSRGKLPFQRGTHKYRPDEALRKTFIALREAWGAAPHYDIQDFTALSLRLDTVMERLRQDPQLAFLIPEFYLQWKQVCEKTAIIRVPEGKKAEQPSSEKSVACKDTSSDSGPRSSLSMRELTEVICDENTRQSVFVFCHSLIQLMEDAYSLLDLESNYMHPDVHGWMNLFRHWSWNPAFRLVYSIAACTFGSRFQNFCERHLDLKVGEIEVARILTVEAVPGTGVPAEAVPQTAELEVALAVARFNHVEKPLLIRLLHKVSRGNFQVSRDDGKSTRTQFRIYAIRTVLNLQIPDDSKDDAAELLRDLTVGFAVVEVDDSGSSTLRWIRIQDHLRRMGFGRKAILELWSRGEARRFEAAPRPEDPPDQPIPPGRLDWYDSESERNIHWVKSLVPWDRTENV
jgi:hypothetical protein